jgi:hypothetical protein
VDGVLHTVLPVETFELVRKTMDNLMEAAPDPDVLNREAGFGVNSDFQVRAQATPTASTPASTTCFSSAGAASARGRRSAARSALHSAVRKALDLDQHGQREAEPAVAGGAAARARRT